VALTIGTPVYSQAKPRTFREERGHITFYNHEIIGARMAKAIALRLRLSRTDIDRIFILVRYHMFHYQPHNTDAAIRRFMRQVGLENVNDILDLREGDRLGSGARKTSWRLEEMKERMIAQLHQPFAITDLAINGDDLMRELELSPGRVIGQILQTLFEHVLEHPEDNQHAALLERARQTLRAIS
jgi:tRNA nucleotidyltransferase/poly(A) polymerase